MYILRKIYVKAVKLNNLLLAIFSIILVLFSSYFIYYLEPHQFDSPMVGFWWVMTTVTTVGYGDYAPVTLAGRFYAIFLYIVGIGLIGVVIAKVVDMLGTYSRLKEEGKLSYKGKDHFVVIGWTKKSQSSIKELINKDTDTHIVLIDQLESSPIQHEQFYYVQGEATSFNILEQANLQEANAVLIYSPPSVDDPVLADGHTLLTATSVKRFAQDQKKEIYTIVEIMENKHMDNFKHAKVDEYVFSNHSTSYMMAKSAVNKGSSHLFRQLLSNQYGDDLYEISKSKSWSTYEHAYEFLKDQGAILISDRQDLSIIRRLKDPIPDSARLFVICDKNTHKNIEEKLTS